MEALIDTKFEKKTYPVEGMTCASYASSIESMLRTTEGVQEANVNFAGKTVQIAFAPTVVKPEQLKRTLHEIGFDLLIAQQTNFIQISCLQFVCLFKGHELAAISI